MDVVVFATFEDFDETLDKRQRGPGSGRKQATHALLEQLCSQQEDVVRKVELLILDWKNPPKQGPQETKVSLRRGTLERKGLRGSRDQLIAKFSSSVWDFVISTQARRLVLECAAQLKARKHLAMLHDYNLPFGPWGQEQTAEQLEDHRKLCEGFGLACASQHLTNFVCKWGGGNYAAFCSYAADYGYFDPPPSLMSPWTDSHIYVTMLNPCPEKGLCVLVKLAALMPDTQFLAVCTTAWTKPWHEQVLKRIPNVKVQTSTEKIEEVLAITRVLIMPSLWQEAFGLPVVEAQLRGIPVVSTGVCGVAEANSVVDTIAEVPIVYDQRTHEVIVGMDMDEAESVLSSDRPGALTMEQTRQAAVTQESTQKVASDEEVRDFANKLKELLDATEDGLRKASEAAHTGAKAFVEGRRGRFLQLLKAMLEQHVAAGDAKPAPALTIQASGFRPPARVERQSGMDIDEDPNFDPDQDFTKVEDFDGQALAQRVLVRLCEQGNLAVAAELLQAKADVNLSEPEIGVTPLIGAANAGHVDICTYLFRKQADVNIPVNDGTGRTALHAASQMGFASVVRLLLEQRADVRVEDLTKTNPLHLAVRQGHAGACELLLKHKANPNQTDDQGHVPINDAVAKDRFDLVTQLIESGSLVNVRNMAGLEAISFSRTPQMQALIMKNDINF